MFPSPRNLRLIEEPHPFFIKPAAQKAYPISARFMGARLGRTAIFYVPVIVGFFGWSFAGKKFVMWQHGVTKH